MRIMALDVGEKRIGVAVSDPLGITAQGLNVLEHDSSVFDRLVELCRDYQVGQLVVGLPLNMNSTHGPAAQAAMDFAAQAAEATGLPVALEDERLTTAAAQRLMIDADVRRSKRRRKVDTMAAVMILQSFMQRREFRE